MEQAIHAIISKVPKGCIFDSHFVINEIIKRFSNEYLSFARGIKTDDPQLTAIVHGQIARKIDSCCKDLIEEKSESWSENIHRTPSKCTCWRKL